MPDELLTRDQAADLLGIDPEAVRSTLRRAGIPEIRGYSRRLVLELVLARRAKNAARGARPMKPVDP